MNVLARSGVCGLILATLALSPAMAAPNDAPTGAKLSGEQIKAMWFNGQPFNGTAPDGTAYRFTFQPDGHATKALASKKGGATPGFWRAIAEGYCVRWTGAVREKCFNVRNEGDETRVRFGKVLVAVWSR